jgi:hypothetical protein
VDQPALAGIGPLNDRFAQAVAGFGVEGTLSKGIGPLWPGGRSLKQNQLYLLIGALVVIVVVLGGYIYHEQTKPKGVQIQFDQNGLKVEKN